jgi:hypothetical protein
MAAPTVARNRASARREAREVGDDLELHRFAVTTASIRLRWLGFHCSLAAGT